jgi:drug/metabolite transporter (DMT)-like permease
MIVGFLGVIGLTLGAKSGDQKNSVSTTDFIMGIIALFVTSILQAVVNVSGRSLTKVHYSVISFYISHLSLFIGVSTAIMRYFAFGKIIEPFKTPEPYFYLAFGALFDTITSTSVTIAF